MATPSEKLSESLTVLHALQSKGKIAIYTNEISRTHRERLCQHGFLQEVIRGWYIPTRPDEVTGESTAWYASYWAFCAAYLTHMKGDDWCLSPEQSISLHAENWTVPPQLLVKATKASNHVLSLLHDTALLVIRSKMPSTHDIEVKNGLRLLTLPTALLACSPGYFRQQATDIRAVLSTVRDASTVLAQLLKGGHSVVAGRLAGAFRNIGRHEIADDIVQNMRLAGYDVRETDLFESPTTIQLPQRELSPYVNRIRLMWEAMRDPIIDCFPAAPGRPTRLTHKKNYLERVDEIYVTDAYHSLSIEGYRVSPALIERVRRGEWNPDEDDGDREHRDALAARGYWLAYQSVHESISAVLEGKNPGQVANHGHRLCYRNMFTPCMTAGLIPPTQLAGYRNGPVYIRGSMHVPPNCDAVRDVMSVFFELLANETEPSVRVVLGHFIFVYIHPYYDGNGRIGRFLMNVMLASGGYPWVVIPVEQRRIYMTALEAASGHNNIVPFAEFLSKLVNKKQVKTGSNTARE